MSPSTDDSLSRPNPRIADSLSTPSGVTEKKPLHLSVQSFPLPLVHCPLHLFLSFSTYKDHTLNLYEHFDWSHTLMSIRRSALPFPLFRLCCIFTQFIFPQLRCTNHGWPPVETTCILMMFENEDSTNRNERGLMSCMILVLGLRPSGRGIASSRVIFLYTDTY